MLKPRDSKKHSGTGLMRETALMDLETDFLKSF